MVNDFHIRLLTKTFNIATIYLYIICRARYNFYISGLRLRYLKWDMVRKSDQKWSKPLCQIIIARQASS